MNQYIEYLEKYRDTEISKTILNEVLNGELKLTQEKIEIIINALENNLEIKSMHILM